MELYYKNLISEDASLEKLVDNLMRVVQGTDESADGTGNGQRGKRKAELTARLQQLKERCRRIEQRTIATAQATDKLVRENVYWSIGLAFAVGLVAGAFLGGSRDKGE
jgi:ElaB/YqjD/DUF883 family membrane-anchored ribosome-binding protein